MPVEDLLRRFRRLTAPQRAAFLKAVRAAPRPRPGPAAVAEALADRAKLYPRQRVLVRVLLAVPPGTPTPTADVLRAVYGFSARAGPERRRQLRKLAQLVRRTGARFDAARLPVFLDWCQDAIRLWPIRRAAKSYDLVRAARVGLGHGRDA